VLLQLLDALLHDRDVLGDLAQENRPLEARDQELSQSRSVRVGAHVASSLPAPHGLGQTRPPDVEDLGQALTKPFVHVRKLAGQVPHHAPAHAVALPLRVQDAIQERVDLGDRIRIDIREGRAQAALDEGPGRPIDDRVAQVLLALEVVVEVALPDPALPEDVVERGRLISLHVHEPRGRVDDLIAGRGPLRALRLARRCLDPHSRRSVLDVLPTSRYKMYPRLSSLSNPMKF
jgi:hypothetical protein